MLRFNNIATSCMIDLSVKKKIFFFSIYPRTKNKGLDLCTTYNVDPVEFVEQWMAFSLSHLNGAEPTLDYLNDLERKELANKKCSKTNKNDRLNVGHSSHSDAANLQQLKIYGSDLDRNEDVGDVMDSYLCNTPKVSANLYSFIK